MTTEQALAFVAFSVVVASTPGPSNTLLTAVGAKVGVLRGLPAVVGVACGMAALMFGVTFGVGALIVQNPAVLGALKWLGAAVLLWLAYRIATARSMPDQHTGGSVGTAAQHVDSSVFEAGRRGRSWPAGTRHDSLPGRPVGFVGAATFQWVNPKSWLACTSAAAAFANTPEGNTALHAAMLATLFALVAFPCCLVWLAFGAIVQRFLHSARAQRAFSLLMAALLALSVGLIVLT